MSESNPVKFVGPKMKFRIDNNMYNVYTEDD